MYFPNELTTKTKFCCFGIFFFLPHYYYNNHTDIPLKRYSEILWAKVHFSPHILIFFFFHIQKELSYTSLTSTGLLQKQSSFDKIGRSLGYCNFWYSCYSRISRRCKITQGAWITMKSEYSFTSNGWYLRILWKAVFFIIQIFLPLGLLWPNN